MTDPSTSAPAAGGPSRAGSRAEAPGVAFLCVLLFLSGAASLADEVVWFKFLTRVFGATTPATATLLAVFMGGLAIGSRWAGGWASRLRRPLLAYALLEAGIGLFALGTPFLFRLVEEAYVALYRASGASSSLLAFRVLLSAAALLPPTILMGATYPVLVRALGEGPAARRRSGVLYGVNTLGAVTGAALCGFVAIPVIGLKATLSAAALLSLLAGLLSFLRSGAAAPAEEAPAPAQPERHAATIAFLAGLVAMASEVLWTRVLVLHLGSSVYTFSLVLSVFLTGLVGGSLAGAAVAERKVRRALVGTQAALCALSVAQLFALTFYSGVLVHVATRVVAARTHGELVLAEALVTALYLLPPTFASGLSFTLLLRLAPGSATRGAALVYSANTVGSILGSLLAGFALVPLIGTQNTLLLLGALAFVPALLLERRLALRLLPAALVLLALPPLLLRKDAVVRSAGVLADAPGERIEFFDEDTSGVVAVRSAVSRPELKSLEINGVNVAGTSPSLVVVQKLQAHLPLAFAARPGRVLHIGVGSGGTSYSTSLHPVAEIDVVEISPTVHRAAKTFFSSVNHGVFADPRVKVIIDDGRSFVLSSPWRFDVVLSDSIHPRYAGNGSLYTLDYFRLCRRRLEPDGVVSMWLPTYSMLPENFRSVVRAFQDAFPNVWVWYPHVVPNSFTIVMATPSPRLSLPQLVAALSRPGVSADLATIGSADPAQLLSYVMLGPEEVAAWVARDEPHEDDRPVVEYESGRLIEGQPSERAIMQDLLRYRSPVDKVVSGLVPGDALSERVVERYRASSAIVASHVAALGR